MEYATGRPVTIRLMGEEQPQNNDSAYGFYVQTPVGAVWYNEEPDNCRSEFIVFVSGLPMSGSRPSIPVPIRVPLVVALNWNRGVLY